MNRINACPACNSEKHGVKSRIALEHTCGIEQIHERSHLQDFAFEKDQHAKPKPKPKPKPKY